jgi:hypothetical protein
MLSIRSSGKESFFVTLLSFLLSTQKRSYPFFFRTRTAGDYQRLTDSSITPRRCMSSSISPTSPCFARRILLGG